MKSLFLALACSYLFAHPSHGCHPECTWVCDDPVCPALCQANCFGSCPNTCENDCSCSLFSDPVKQNCTPPLETPCTTCQASQKGLNCSDTNNRSCECNLSCELPCSWDCQTPSNCPKPKCELKCEKPACEFQEPNSSFVYPAKKHQ